jgi:hypothetical protein
MTTADHRTRASGQRHWRGAAGWAALGALAASLLLAACGSSGSKITGGTTTTVAGSAASASVPVAGTSPHTYHYFSKSVLNELFHSDGSMVTDQNEAPKPGDYFVSANTDYLGDHTRHSATAAGSDHIVCVIQSVSGEGGAAICNGEAAFGGSLIVVDHQALSLSQGAENNTLAITGGTGRYRGATGQVVFKSISANSDDSDFDITISAPATSGPAPAAKAAVPAVAGPATLRYYQKADANAFYTPDGKAVTDQNSPPKVGDYIVSTDLDYVGDHLHHDPTAVATDHITCLITNVTASGGTGLCDGEFAFGGSMFFADHQTVSFADNSNPVIQLTGGTGKLQGVTGSIKSTSVGNTDDSDVVVSLKAS